MSELLNGELDAFNLVANLIMIVGGGVITYGILVQRRMIRRIESVIAPKAGIEAHLNRQANLVEADPDGLCLVSEDGLIEQVNNRMEDITGYHRTELVGQSVEILVPDGFKSVHPSHREGFMLSGSPARPMRGLSFRHKRGREIKAEIYIARLKDPMGNYAIAKVRVDGGQGG